MEPVCRVCMSGSVTLVELFAKRKHLTKEPSLAEMLSECVDCVVKQDDPLPKLICLACVLDTQNAYKFKRKCEQSYHQFWELLREDKAICELFATDDWAVPECTLEDSSASADTSKCKAAVDTKILSQNPLNISENSIDISCVKIEKLDSDEEDSGKEKMEENQVQSTCDIDISCVKTEKLDNHAVASTATAMPDNQINMCNNTEGSSAITKTDPNSNVQVKSNFIKKPSHQPGTYISLKPMQTNQMQLYKVEGCLFKCPYCPKTGSRRVDVVRHMSIHNAQKPYKCIHCPKAFNRRSELHTHLYIHSGERPYVCHHCSQAFNHPSNLQRHIRTHTDKPPYKCSQCPKSFQSKQDAVEHILVHNEIRPYKCPHCNSMFRKHTCRPVHQRGKFTFLSDTN